MNTQSFQKGVGLIEVLIAMVVLGLGLIMIGAFQGSLFNVANDSKARGIATKLAQGKLDDLKSFETVTHAAGENSTTEFAFEDIGDDTGGQLANTGTPWLPAGNVTLLVDPSTGKRSTDENLSGVNLTRTWTVVDMFQPPGNLDPGAPPVDADGWNNHTDPDYGDLPDTPDFKQVTVTVGWQNPDGTAEDVKVTGTVQNMPLSRIGFALKEDTGFMQPVVRYGPGLAPQVIDITIDTSTGRALEATKPEPTVIDQAGTTVVRIEEVGYTNVVGQETTLWRNSLLTVNCVCDPSGALDPTDPTLHRYPVVPRNIYEPSWIGDADIENTGAWVVEDEESLKRAAAAASGTYHIGSDNLNLSKQPIQCDTCCGSHHDYAAPSSALDYDATVGAVADPPYYDPQRPVEDTFSVPTGLYHTSATDGHTHFFPDNDGNLVAQSAGSGIYLENCRMIRVGGYWWATTDWNLVEVNLMPVTFLQTDAGVLAYQAYVKAVVAKYIGRTDWSSISADADADGHPDKPWPTSDSLAVNGTLELLARAIYVDYMAPDLLSELSDQTKNPTTDDYLPRIPFHEVNVTKLANWSITALDGTATTAATVCDEPISNSDYCRGIVTRLAAGDVRVWGRIEPSNSGITDTAAIDTHDQVFSPDNPADPSVSIFDITDGATSTDSFVISGSITIAANAGTLNYSDITVIGKGFDPATDLDKSDSINCTTQNAGDGTYTFECAIEKDFDSDGDGVFDQASGNFVIDIGGYNYVYEDNQGNRETKNNEVDGTVSAGANLDGTCVTDDGQEADTTQFGFTDLSSDTTLDLAITKDNNTSTGGTCLIP